MISSSQTASVIEASFRLDKVIEWTNPALYCLETDYTAPDAVIGVKGDNTRFYICYVFLCSVFYLTLFLLSFGGSLFFKVVKKENFRETIKLLMRIIAVAQQIYVSILAVPFLTILI